MNDNKDRQSVTPTKLAALTFDDGPNADTTPLILDKLEKYKVVASFFVNGKYINETVKPVMQRQLDLGCDLENHSWSHPDMSEMTRGEVEKEISDTNDIIYRTVGVTPKFFRPPYIATSPNLYTYVDLPFICGIGCNDWDEAFSTEMRAEIILNNVQDGDIILLHDMSGNINTVKALELIIPAMQGQGYQFVTVKELFELKGVEPNVKSTLWTNVS